MNIAQDDPRELIQKSGDSFVETYRSSASIIPLSQRFNGDSIFLYEDSDGNGTIESRIDPTWRADVDNLSVDDMYTNRSIDSKLEDDNYSIIDEAEIDQSNLNISVKEEESSQSKLDKVEQKLLNKVNKSNIITGLSSLSKSPSKADVISEIPVAIASSPKAVKTRKGSDSKPNSKLKSLNTASSENLDSSEVNLAKYSPLPSIAAMESFALVHSQNDNSPSITEVSKSTSNTPSVRNVNSRQLNNTVRSMDSANQIPQVKNLKSRNAKSRDRAEVDREQEVDISTDSLDHLQVTGIPFSREDASSANISKISKRNMDLDHFPPSDTNEYQKYNRKVSSEMFETVAADSDHNRVSMSNISPKVLEEHTASITRLRAPRKTNILISASIDGTIKLWGIDDVRSRLTLDASSFLPPSHSSKNVDATSTTQFVDQRPERKISLGTKNNTIDTLNDNDSVGNAPIQSIGGGSSIKIMNAWAEESCESIWAACSDGALRVWDGEGKALRLLKGHEDAVTVMEGMDSIGGVQSSNFCLLASGSVDRTVRIWDSRAKKSQVFLFRGHGDTVMSLRWGDGGRSLVSGGKDKTIRIWDTRAGRYFLYLYLYSLCIYYQLLYILKVKNNFREALRIC